MTYLLLIISAIFVNNIVLAQFLGICPFLGVSKRVPTAIGMAGAVTFVMVIATIVTWMIQNFVLVPFNITYLQTISFILVIAALVQMVEIVLKKVSPSLYQALGVFLPLITTNCAILGVAVMTIGYNYNIVESVQQYRRRDDTDSLSGRIFYYIRHHEYCLVRRARKHRVAYGRVFAFGHDLQKIRPVGYRAGVAQRGAVIAFHVRKQHHLKIRPQAALPGFQVLADGVDIPCHDFIALGPGPDVALQPLHILSDFSRTRQYHLFCQFLGLVRDDIAHPNDDRRAHRREYHQQCDQQIEQHLASQRSQPALFRLYCFRHTILLQQLLSGYFHN